MRKAKHEAVPEAPTRFTRWERTHRKPLFLYEWKFRTVKRGKLVDLSPQSVFAVCACRARWEAKKIGISFESVKPIVFGIVTPREEMRDAMGELCDAVLCECGLTEEQRNET